MPIGPAGAIEVRTDDFRVSEMGPDGATGYEAQQSKLAFDPVNDQLPRGLAWRRRERRPGRDLRPADRRRTSNAVGGDFLIAQVGTAGDDATDAIEPAVVWSGDNEEFVVVYTGDEDATDTVSIVSDTFEIYAQRVSTAGVPQGGPLRVSDMGSDDANGSFDANFPDIAWNSTSNQFLVVWQGDDNTAPLVNNKTEIHGQLLANTSGDLVQLGANDFRISQVGVDGRDGDQRPRPRWPTTPTAISTTWRGRATTTPSRPPCSRCTAHPCRRQASSPARPARCSTRSRPATRSCSPTSPPIRRTATSPWCGRATTAPTSRDLPPAGRYRRRALGHVAGHQRHGNGRQHRLHRRSAGHHVRQPAEQYVVVWSGDDSTGGMVDDEYEVFLRRLTSAGATSGTRRGFRRWA